MDMSRKLYALCRHRMLQDQIPHEFPERLEKWIFSILQWIACVQRANPTLRHQIVLEKATQWCSKNSLIFSSRVLPSFLNQECSRVLPSCLEIRAAWLTTSRRGLNFFAWWYAKMTERRNFKNLPLQSKKHHSWIVIAMRNARQKLRKLSCPKEQLCSDASWVCKSQRQHLSTIMHINLGSVPVHLSESICLSIPTPMNAHMTQK